MILFRSHVEQSCLYSFEFHPGHIDGNLPGARFRLNLRGQFWRCDKTHVAHGDQGRAVQVDPR
jgi:hypothetical protein